VIGYLLSLLSKVGSAPRMVRWGSLHAAMGMRNGRRGFRGRNFDLGFRRRGRCRGYGGGWSGCRFGGHFRGRSVGSLLLHVRNGFGDRFNDFGDGGLILIGHGEEFLSGLGGRLSGTDWRIMREKRRRASLFQHGSHKAVA